MFKRYKYSDVLFSYSRLELDKPVEILFDFSHTSTHLGDRLFFFPLISALIKNGINVCLSSSDKISKSLFLELDNSLVFNEFSFNKKSGLVIIPAAAFSALRNNYKHSKIAVCNFINIKNKSIIDELEQGISKALDINICSGEVIKNSTYNNFSFIEDSKNYFIFSNYIDSGRFRKYFVDESALIRKAKFLKEKGFKIIHVGSSKDLENDYKKYNFIDYDMRGKVSIEELVSLISNEQVKGVIAYDNFIMHLSGIFNKKTFVLFRGRFSKTNRINHIKYINTAFFDIKNPINYLK